jgi:ribonuclease D
MSESNIVSDIVFINDDNALVALANTLATKNAFGFDTEFDRFWREYGFKLFLLQIFDGEKCYLIDPLAVKDLRVLWAVFENPAICKVAYACIEDIQILKINGCNVVNIFDLQVAAKLCNHTGNSFADLILEKFNVVVDKSNQRSNWRKRPLTNEQMLYASNDVRWLLQLKDEFYKTAVDTNVYEMLQEENELCEGTIVTEYVVKLSSKQSAIFSPYHQEILMQLFYTRNEIAKAYNMPPANIVNDAVLEKIVEDKSSFYKYRFTTGFCGRLIEDINAQEKFTSIIDSIDQNAANVPEKAPRQVAFESYEQREKRKLQADENCKLLNGTIVERYGNTAGEFILRGLKKSLQVRPYEELILRKYQRKVIDGACIQLGIVL